MTREELIQQFKSGDSFSCIMSQSLMTFQIFEAKFASLWVVHTDGELENICNSVEQLVDWLIGLEMEITDFKPGF